MILNFWNILLIKYFIIDFINDVISFWNIRYYLNSLDTCLNLFQKIFFLFFLSKNDFFLKRNNSYFLMKICLNTKQF